MNWLTYIHDILKKIYFQFESNAFGNDFDPKNFLDKVDKVDSTGRAIPEWRRHVLAKHAAEKAQKDFEERKQVTFWTNI